MSFSVRKNLFLNMFVAVFAFVLATTYAAELPSYIDVCGRKNPNLNQCFLNNVDNVRGRICQGNEELGIPVIEPMKIDRLVVSESNNNKIYLDGVQVTGICTFIINFIRVDLDKFTFELDLSFEKIYVNSTYDIDLRILVPLAAKAPFYLTSDSVSANINIQWKTTNKNGKEYMYASEVKTKIVINEYTARNGFKENELNQFNQVISGLIGSNQKEFIERITPQIEKEISKLAITIFNGVCKRFSFDELFPDRE